MRRIAILVMLAGVIFLTIGSYQIYQTKTAEKESLKEVNELLSNREEHAVKNPLEFKPSPNEKVGKLQIPSIDAELAIVEGTDPDDLAEGVGHYSGSAYPEQNDQIVLSGHRDTVFRSLGEVKLGDTFTIQLPHGDYTYEMVDSKIVDADDTSIIKSTAPDEELVISTCYPFSYVGNAPDRYIIYAKPIQTD
ncbi:class D sortase [Paraliobacillus salinarum]|uniref:class D sortase n=1 Tax=Paraliobacillus salinarum TaxID=1158996 RepID=UPI0015F71831|nr:class D sortase [Paraliobacillus salinarum]